MPTWEKTSQVSPFPARTSFKIYLVNDRSTSITVQTDLQIDTDCALMLIELPLQRQIRGNLQGNPSLQTQMFSDIEFTSIADTDFNGEMKFDKLQSLNRSPDKQSSGQMLDKFGFRMFANAVRGQRALKQKFESVRRDSHTSNEIQIPPGGSKITKNNF